MRSSPHIGEYPADVFECLADRDRREVVAALRERGASSLDELAATVAEAGDRRSSRTSRLEIALHHTHLPKLDDAGLVEYDPERDVVEPTVRTAAADVVARTVERCGALAPETDPSESGRPRIE